MKIKLVIAYDGTAYAGWQLQKTGMGVQEKIEAALASVFQAPIRVHGSSRTDTGVHALGMVAHFELDHLKVTTRKLPLALNAGLPPDIRVLRAARCADSFHARFDARAKQYRYFVWNQAVANPLLRLHSWHIPGLLDLPAMREGAAAFLGTHDFRGFATTRPYQPRSSVRTVRRCDLLRKGPLLTFVIEADGFLYRMCRGMVGTLVQIGQAKFRPADVARMLETKQRAASGMTAPARGLVLWKVFY